MPKEKRQGALKVSPGEPDLPPGVRGTEEGGHGCRELKVEASEWGSIGAGMHRCEQRNRERERGARASGTSGPSQPLSGAVVHRMLLYWGGAPLGRLRMWKSKASSLRQQRKPQAPNQTAAGNPEPPTPS